MFGFGKKKVDGKTFDEWIVESSNLFESENYEKCIEFLDKALEMKPENDMVFYLKGSALVLINRPDEAIDCFNKSLKFNPHNYDTWSSKSKVLFALGREEEAISCYDKILENEFKIEPFYDKATALANLGRNKEAAEGYNKFLEICKEATESEPLSYFAWYNKGLALHGLKRMEEAIACFDKALEINPEMASALSDKGLVLSETNLHDEAIKYFDKALGIELSENTYLYKGDALANLNRKEEAIGCYDKALEIFSIWNEPLKKKETLLRKIEDEKKAASRKIYENQKDEAETAINNLIQLIETAKSIGISPDETQLEKAREKFKIKECTDVLQIIEKSHSELESSMNNVKPEFEITLSDNTYKLNAGKRTQLILKNKGKLTINDITLEFSDDVDIKILSEFVSLKPGETQTCEVLLKPIVEGELLIEVSTTYTDDIKRNFEEMKDIWINVTNTASTITTKPSEENIFQSNIPPISSLTSSFPQEIVHRYSDPQFIGKGGFARVFRTQRDDGRIVAVKVPLSLDESTGKSFIREISVWQRLSHENIISLYDMNVIPLPYLELEYADGGALDSIKKPLDVEDVSKIMFNIADGIKHAHEQGVAHRDLKPQNILLTGDMTPKITDWGLSKVIAESKTSSRFGYTPLYAAPEQISPKKFGRPDFRTDIYQLGVIFYELATGKLPFEGDDFSEIGFAIINDKPEKPSSLNPECNKLDKIILKCLKKKPDERYQNISDMQQDLAKYLKVEYTKSLAKSAGNLKRSCIYCGDLVLLHAKLGNVEDALKFAVDMKNYSQDGVSDELEDIVNQMDYLAGRKQPIGDELMTKIGVVLHQLKMGR